MEREVSEERGAGLGWRGMGNVRRRWVMEGMCLRWE